MASTGLGAASLLFTVSGDNVYCCKHTGYSKWIIETSVLSEVMEKYAVTLQDHFGKDAAIKASQRVLEGWATR